MNIEGVAEKPVVAAHIPTLINLDRGNIAISALFQTFFAVHHFYLSIPASIYFSTSSSTESMKYLDTFRRFRFVWLNVVIYLQVVSRGMDCLEFVRSWYEILSDGV